MKEAIILERVRERLGIKSLNGMQEQMRRCASSAVLLLSPTGSGKTVAFSIPMLRSLDNPSGRVQAVVMAPSRELVMQIASVVRELAAGYKTVALYGGHSMIDETRSLSVVPDIVIATPGRLLDHLNRGNIDLMRVRTLVLDEYDKSLELGFHEEMRRIVRRMGRFSLTILTSATVLKEMPSFMPMKAPTVIDFTETDDVPESKLQTVHVESPLRDKIETLIDLLRSLPNGKAIVFVNHRESVERVYDLLRKAGLPAGMYHGGLEQFDREKAIDLLNNGTTPILVSTDLGSRGLDIDAVQSVIHYHLPTSAESMTHRNGRTARMGADGTAYFITSEGENIPDYVDWMREYVPTGDSPDPIRCDVVTLYFNAGKKEKISRGDVVGYLVNKGGLMAQQVGKIAVKDHCVLVAVPANVADEVLSAIAPHKIKNQRVRVTIFK